jgi:hypothetical protein
MIIEDVTGKDEKRSVVANETQFRDLSGVTDKNHETFQMRRTAKTPSPSNRSPGHNLNPQPLAYEAAVDCDVHLHKFTTPKNLLLKYANSLSSNSTTDGTV